MNIQKRAHQVNTLLGIGVSLFIGIQSIIRMGFKDGGIVLVESAIVAMLLVGIYFMPRIKEGVRAILLSMIPMVVLLAIAVFDEGFLLDTHYTVYLTICMIALYFNERLVLIYMGLYNIVWIIFYTINPEALLGNMHDIGTFIQILGTVNSAMILLYFLAKWGNQLVKDSVKRELEMQEILKNRESTLETIKEVSGVLNKNIDTLNFNIKGSLEFANQLSEAVGGIAQSVAGQTDRVVGINKHLYDTGEQMVESKDISGEVLRESGKMSAKVQAGKEKMVYMTEQIGMVQNTVLVSKDLVLELQRNMSEITGLLESIKGISEQSNLLALNAAIEAARAGEEGRGFAIVAQEVRKLAENSGDIVEQINTIMGGIVRKAAEAVDAVQQGDTAAEESKGIIQEVTDYFMQFEDAFSHVKRGIERESNIIDGLNKTFEDVHTQVETIVGVAEEQTAVTEEVEGNIIEQNQKMIQLSEAVSEISKLSAVLRENFMA